MLRLLNHSIIDLVLKRASTVDNDIGIFYMEMSLQRSFRVYFIFRVRALCSPFF